MAKLSALTELTSPDNADLLLTVDVSDTSMAASGTDKRLTWTNTKAFLKTYFDTLYATVASLSSYVPYTGATADLNMGVYEVITSSVHANSSAGVTIHNTSSQDVAIFGAGGGVNGTFYGNISMNTVNKIINMADPSSAQDAATKAYADGLVANLLDYRGGYDASSNVYPSTGGSGTAGAVLKGDMWIVSVAGTLGGSAVQIGDSVIANVDTPGQTAGNWNILNANISYVPEDVANKATTMSGNTASDTKYLSAKAVYDWGVATFAALAGSISQAFAVSQLEVGHASDTTISRVSAGRVAVEGSNVIVASDNATASDINTGTSTTKFSTPDALAGSNFGIRYVAVTLNGSTALTTSDKAYFRIPAALTGMNLVSVSATVGTGAAGASSSGTPTFTVKNVTDNNQMLSTSLTVDANEYTSATAATAAVINTSFDDVITDDLIEVACTTAGTGTTYATITLGFQLP